jgi:predicted O-methyltransferase YrrM
MESLKRYLIRRPRILNLLHWLRLVGPTSQTNERELAALGKYAAGAHIALEIGSFQGVSSAIIAASIDRGGTLYCVDPWLEVDRKKDPCLAIFERHIRRRGLRDRIKIVRKLSANAANDVPPQVDFIFIDGDHSLKGISVDWTLVKQKLRTGGVVCMHDVRVPAFEPWRRLESVSFFEDVILRDAEFVIIDEIHSMAAMRRA